jgi:hypothetical protein
MKQAIKAIFSTLYMTVKPSKPFNPIIGETFQGYICLDQEKAKVKFTKNEPLDEKQEVFRVFCE